MIISTLFFIQAEIFQSCLSAKKGPRIDILESPLRSLSSLEISLCWKAKSFDFVINTSGSNDFVLESFL